MYERLFRCAGDIQFDDSPPSPGKTIDVRLKPFSETCNYLQYQKPLTKQHPCFFAQVRSLAPNSIVTIGIAGPDIYDDIHPGNWNGTVGYRNTGRCFSSHYVSANTEGEKFGVGDIFGVLITFFGKDVSTVIFLKNGQPVATRYLFESNHQKYLPTIALENGPIDLGLVWPEACLGYPKYSEKNMLHWIRSPEIKYDGKNDLFYTDNKTIAELIIQSPLPLSREIQHYEVIVDEVGPTGEGPTIGIATCSPLNPPPTCALLNDYFRWHPDGKLLKMKIGQRMGWGIHYNPESRERDRFDDKEEQLVLCYVTIDVTIVYAKMMLQPPGGWYPVAMLHPYASKLKIDMESNPKPVVTDKLDDLFKKLQPEAVKIVDTDTKFRALETSQFRKSKELEVSIGNIYTKVRLSKEKKGIHIIQFKKHLQPEERYYSVSVRRMGDSSVVCMGIAPPDFPLNRYPGRVKDTIGYHSRDGKMYYNDKDNGNMTGKRYGKGDTVGIEIEVFEEKMSVALFNKNGLPIGTRFLTEKEHSHFLPTIAICGNGSNVEIDVVWQNRIASPPVFSVTNIHHWCLPEGATYDMETNIIDVEQGHTEAEAIQAPYSLHRTYNHFEVELIDEFDENTPPPAIALCTASPFDPTPKSNFKQDFIRFWATGEAQKAVKKGDLMGWGMLYPDDTKHHDEEQLVICYLTINRDVALTRVMYQPPGGFYPVVLLPPGVDKVKLNFGATIITEHPFTPGAIQQLMYEAESMIAEEEKKLAAGGDPEDWDSDENKAKYLKPVPKTQATTAMEKFIEKFLPGDAPGQKRKSNKMANLVEMMMKTEIDPRSPPSPPSETREVSGDSVENTDKVASIEHNAIVMIKDSYQEKHEASTVTDNNEVATIQVKPIDEEANSPDDSIETAENGSASESRDSSRDSHRTVQKTNSDFAEVPNDRGNQTYGETIDLNRLGKRSKSCVIL